MTHRDIRPLIDQIRQQRGFKFTTFDDVDERVISEWTGLTRYRSTLARDTKPLSRSSGATAMKKWRNLTRRWRSAA